ncbi:MAG: penicillin-binding protein 1C, partial [Bacteroidota bacterium]
MIAVIKRCLTIGGVLIVLGIASVFLPMPKEDFSPQSVQSLRVADRNGIVLREFFNDQQGRGVWKPLDEISPFVRTATIAVEDKRFYTHFGIDPIAVARSIAENVRSFSFKSGGSTITQQVIRNVYHHPRTLLYKVLEMWYALRLERTLNKEGILEQYLNRAPYGNQLFGIEAASRWYFEKPAKDLSPAEAALLAALPNSPSYLNPNRNLTAALSRQRTVLQRMKDQHYLSADAYRRAEIQPVQVVPPEAHFKAPHAVQMALSLQPNVQSGTIATTIDFPMQEQVQWLVRGHLNKLRSKNVHNAAVVVIDNETMEIRALVGSADFFDEKNDGQVNGATAFRQPGSSIKAFTYACALEHGLTPATILPDIPTAIPDHHGDYVPENYDRHYHGPVRARTALACSYNVPAVRVLQLIGKSALLNTLRNAGCTSLDKDAEFYGYGLTLGNAEVSLLELTTAYTLFPNKGVWHPSLLVQHEDSLAAPHRVFNEETVCLLTDMLKDPIARRPAFGGNFYFPFQCAVKTGTTKDYKDNWTMGFTTRYTVGVWVGNFDGEEMRRVSGVSGAGPIFTDVMTFLHRPPFGVAPDDFEIPNTLVQKTVCARSGKLPAAACAKTIDEWFLFGSEPTEACAVHKEFFVREQDGRRVKKTFEIFPREYSQWMQSAGISVPPPDAVPVAEQKKTARYTLEIVSPNSGDYYKIDPVLRSEYQTISIAGFVPDGCRDVKL